MSGPTNDILSIISETNDWLAIARTSPSRVSETIVYCIAILLLARNNFLLNTTTKFNLIAEKGKYNSNLLRYIFKNKTQIKLLQLRILIFLQ